MADDAPAQTFKVRENKGYLEMMIDGLLLKVQEASKDGPGEFLEITIEMIWTNIPTAEKRTLLVWDGNGGEAPALEAWAMADKMISEYDRVRESELYMADPINIRRIHRKAQIVTDTLQGLELLYKKPPISRPAEGDGEDLIQWGDDSG